jgi:cytochrome c peroxidase
MILLLHLLIFCLDSLAAPATDQQLDHYINLFQLRPLPAPAKKDVARYYLGMQLFHDKRLSGKENISCHSCHTIKGHSGDTLPLAIGEGGEGLAQQRQQAAGKVLARNTQALYNLGLPGVRSLFWDGRVTFDYLRGGWLTPEPGLNGPNPAFKAVASTLDSLLAVQALFPIASPDEMLGTDSTLPPAEAWEAVMQRLLQGPAAGRYLKLFQAAYPGVEEFNIGHVANALAELQRHLFLASDTPWDRYLGNQKQYLKESSKRGANLFFGKASCHNCHNGSHLSSFTLLNVGAPQVGPGVKNGDDKGYFEVTGELRHLYRFRVPPLRNVALTAPYMHSGALPDLWSVLEHYNDPIQSLMSFQWNPWHPAYQQQLPLEMEHQDLRLQWLPQRILPKKLQLSVAEKAELWCFLTWGLTDVKLQHLLSDKVACD